ncbi:MAG TPA: hypothetical protein VIN04_11165 [Myxococcota bacterium]
MRILRTLPIVLGGLLLAGPAAAVSYWYADVKTSSLLGDLHGSVLLPGDPGSLSDLIAGSDLDLLGSGLGSGKVEAGKPLTTTHVFAPGLPVASVVSASLVVSVVDDLDLGFEEATVSIDGALLDGGSGKLLIDILGGSVAALVQTAGDSIGVTIAATQGDFKVAFSALKVKFETGTRPSPGPGPQIPEPSAALVFAAGLLIASRSRRR